MDGRTDKSIAFSYAEGAQLINGHVLLNDFFLKAYVRPTCVLILISTNDRLAVWLSGNALASINVVALRQTRLVPSRYV